MFTSKFEAGTPSVGIRWPKTAVVKTQVVKNADGRFECRVSVNDGQYFNLPGAHASEEKANRTLDAYLAENTFQESSDT